VPVKSVSDLVSWLNGMQGNASYGSSGMGGAPHMSAELFKSMTKVEAVHVPYKGSTAAHPDLISGRLAFMFDTVPALAPQVAGGKLKVLAVTTVKRSSALPDVPTMQEAGVKDYETSSWGGILAPAGTPKEVVAKLHAEINKALASPDVKERLLKSGIEPASQSPKQFADFIVSEMKRWGEVAKSAGIQPD
jgi:tripartite-type tricarboxylate transporter receptor subunit TctC